MTITSETVNLDQSECRKINSHLEIYTTANLGQAFLFQVPYLIAIFSYISWQVRGKSPEEYCKFAIKNSLLPVRSSSLPVRSTCHMHVSVAVPDKLYSCFFYSKTLILHVNHSRLVTFGDIVKVSSPYLAILQYVYIYSK